MEAPQLHGVEISKVQRIAQDGFIDGAFASSLELAFLD